MKRVRAMSRLHEKARLLMSTPAVGPIVSLTFACAIDDPSRFTSSKQAGPQFWLTPEKDQFREPDYTAPVCQPRCAPLRRAPFQPPPAHLTPPIQPSPHLQHSPD